MANEPHVLKRLTQNVTRTNSKKTAIPNLPSAPREVNFLPFFGQQLRRESEGTKSCRIKGESEYSSGLLKHGSGLLETGSGLLKFGPGLSTVIPGIPGLSGAGLGHSGLIQVSQRLAYASQWSTYTRFSQRPLRGLSGLSAFSYSTGRHCPP